MLHLELPAETRSVTVARRRVSDYVRSAQCAGIRSAPGAELELSQVVALLTTELVSNAVVHGGGDVVRVTVDCTVGAVRVTCSDDDPTPPTVHTVAPDATGGRGMALIDRLAASWGSVRAVTGKQVWFQVGVGA